MGFHGVNSFVFSPKHAPILQYKHCRLCAESGGFPWWIVRVLNHESLDRFWEVFVLFACKIFSWSYLRCTVTDDFVVLCSVSHSKGKSSVIRSLMSIALSPRVGIIIGLHMPRAQTWSLSFAIRCQQAWTINQNIAQNRAYCGDNFTKLFCLLGGCSVGNQTE
jgi:hypothetical protein